MQSINLMWKCSFISFDNCYLLTDEPIEFDKNTLFLIKGITISHDNPLSSCFFQTIHLLNIVSAIKNQDFYFPNLKCIQVDVTSLNKKVSEDIIQLYKGSRFTVKTEDTYIKINRQPFKNIFQYMSELIFI